MQFVWTDPYDGASSLHQQTLRGRPQRWEQEKRTVALMQLCDLPCVATSLDHIVVELVPERHSSQPWPREFCKGTEIQTVDSLRDAIYGECEKGEKEILKGEEPHVGYNSMATQDEDQY